ncbi:MAG: GNAT family N-acetyltransferase [Pseudoflavonifractor sp.]
MDIRFVLPSERDQLARNVVTSFPSKTPSVLLEAMEGELYRPDEGRYLGCFDDDGTLAGSLLMMDFTLNVRGVMMPMGAAAYISANFLHKKERMACNLLKVLMRYYAKLGTPIGCLHPFSPAFYGKMGYGPGNEYYLYQPKPAAIRSFGDKSGLSYAKPEEKDEVVAFYRAYAAQTHGMTVHHFMDAHRIFDQPYVVLCRREGRLTGYLSFEFIEVDHYTDMYHDLRVNEMVYEDLDTLKQFMTFFASQVDQIDRVRIFTPDPNLQLMFINPDSGENRAHDGCIHEIARRTMGYMVRIFDIPAYFRMQSHCEGPVSRPFTLALQIHDDFMPQNDGCFYLRIEGDRLSVLDNAAADVTLTADIGVLSSLVMGVFSLETALEYGRLALSDRAYLEDIQKAIGWSKKPKNLTYF